jgi:hypothetical protein
MHFESTGSLSCRPPPRQSGSVHPPLQDASTDTSLRNGRFFPAFIKYGFILSSLHHINLLKGRRSDILLQKKQGSPGETR